MFVGAVLMLSGLYGLSSYYHEPVIFKKALTGTVVIIIGVAIAIILTYILIMPNFVTMLHQMYPGWDGNLNSQPNMPPNVNAIDPSQFFKVSYAIITNITILFVILFVFVIIATVFIRQALIQLREKSNIGMFETAGTLMLVGGGLTIILIGYAIIWVAILLLTIAFFQIKNQEPNTAPCDRHQPTSITT
jgi:uncharacterized membrane protein